MTTLRNDVSRRSGEFARPSGTHEGPSRPSGLHDRTGAATSRSLHETFRAMSATLDPGQAGPDLAIMKGMSEQQLQAYALLTPEERAAYDRLHEAAANRPNDGRAIRNVQGLLDAGQLQQFLAVQGALEGSKHEDGPKDLRNALFTGRLTTDGSRRRNALDYLAPMAAGGHTGMGASRINLLNSVVKDLLSPWRIQQGMDNKDCGGTVMACMLARTNPSEYARMVTFLAENGKVTAGGERWTLTPFKETREDGPATRPLSQRIFAASFVDHQEGERDGVATGGIASLISGSVGLYGAELADGLTALTQQPWRAMFVPDPGEGASALDIRSARREATSVLLEHMDARQPCAVNMGGHWILARTMVERDGHKFISYMDGSGELQEIQLRDLMPQVKGVVYDPAVSVVPEWLHDVKWDDPGGGVTHADGMDDIVQ